MIYTDSTLESAQFLGLPLLAVCSLALLEQRLNGVRWTRKCGRTSYFEEQLKSVAGLFLDTQQQM